MGGCLTKVKVKAKTIGPKSRVAKFHGHIHLSSTVAHKYEFSKLTSIPCTQKHIINPKVKVRPQVQWSEDRKTMPEYIAPQESQRHGQWYIISYRTTIPWPRTCTLVGSPQAQTDHISINATLHHPQNVAWYIEHNGTTFVTVSYIDGMRWIFRPSGQHLTDLKWPYRWVNVYHTYHFLPLYGNFTDDPHSNTGQ